MHLVVDHVVAELFALGALVLLTSPAMAERRSQATHLAAPIERLPGRVCRAALVGGQNRFGAWLDKASIALSARSNRSSLFLVVHGEVQTDRLVSLSSGEIEYFLCCVQTQPHLVR